jgi:hypothetical protein
MRMSFVSRYCVINSNKTKLGFNAVSRLSYSEVTVYFDLEI